MSDLLDKLKTIQKNSFTLDESESFNNKDMIRTKVPIINAAFSGDRAGPYPPDFRVPPTPVPRAHGDDPRVSA